MFVSHLSNKIIRKTCIFIIVDNEDVQLHPSLSFFMAILGALK